MYGIQSFSIHFLMHAWMHLNLLLCVTCYCIYNYTQPVICLQALNRTLYLAFPELLKFLLCALILFIAFALTGWIVLGPFHEKFVDLNSSIESLFGLFNGDDIYNTFVMIDPDDDIVVYAYSRFFLYIFLALFIYAVLNLFTSLVITAYDSSQVTV